MNPPPQHARIALQAKDDFSRLPQVFSSLLQAHVRRIVRTKGCALASPNAGRGLRAGFLPQPSSPWASVVARLTRRYGNE
jgi:hypothetical protein